MAINIKPQTLRSQIFILATGIILGIMVMYLINTKKNATVKISHNMVLQEIESLGNLEVTKYSIQDMMEYKKIRRWLPNAKTGLIIYGEVICCVDLTKLKPEDITVSEKTIYLQLPSPEICHVKVDHSKSRVYDMEFGLWESTDIVDEAYTFAEQQLNEKAKQLNMLSQSRDNAVNLLKPILKAMGFEEVVITFRSKSGKG
ncbi:MAG: DUF4230 domain-containing protein [Dysgonomonas mossii]|uniref:DUF4230 domain-containing protein n=1 Tax=Dysgonomonas mossii TaxID=163665 RepID=UPI001D8FE66A|nr:DUF4230 domain-containing protein [Dysgonomonas mossii]MBS5795985.1 DUF4230 domain-containing protein [Dysgonomonas mossii]MBS7111104.1 DUF4230 domain-containing protein [Dysgonomonas mossii]